MALMYEVNTLNAAMIRAAEACRQDLPEGEKVNKVLACFAGMKPVDAEPVVHAEWLRDDHGHTYCSKCHERLPYIHCYIEESCSDYDEEWDEEMPEGLYCPNCGARMDGGPGQDD